MGLAHFPSPPCPNARHANRAGCRPIVSIQNASRSPVGKPCAPAPTRVKNLVSVDFFTVPTVRFQVLYVFLVLANNRRRILHFGVTAIPPRSGLPNRSADEHWIGNGREVRSSKWRTRRSSPVLTAERIPASQIWACCSSRGIAPDRERPRMRASRHWIR